MRFETSLDDTTRHSPPAHTRRCPPPLIPRGSSAPLSSRSSSAPRREAAAVAAAGSLPSIAEEACRRRISGSDGAARDRPLPSAARSLPGQPRPRLLPAPPSRTEAVGAAPVTCCSEAGRAEAALRHRADSTSSASSIILARRSRSSRLIPVRLASSPAPGASAASAWRRATSALTRERALEAASAPGTTMPYPLVTSLGALETPRMIQRWLFPAPSASGNACLAVSVHHVPKHLNL